MIYRVYIEPPALDDIDAAYLWIRRVSLRAANDWLDGLGDAIDALARMPASHALAPEAAAIGCDIHEMHYGRYPQVYRVFFVIRKRKVHVLHVRHAAQRPLVKGQVKEMQSMPLSKRQKK